MNFFLVHIYIHGYIVWGKNLRKKGKNTKKANKNELCKSVYTYVYFADWFKLFDYVHVRIHTVLYTPNNNQFSWIL